MKITVSTLVPAPIHEVWRAYTTPEDIKAWNTASPDWHTTAASVDLRAGGKFSSRMEAKDGSFGFDFAGEYTKVVPLQLIEYSFGDRAGVVEFSEGAKGVTVTVTFDAETTHSEEQQRTGWQAILDSFSCHVSTKPAIGSAVISELTTEELQAFADAWNRHDVDALMSFMTEDCVFESSAGADICGTRHVGRDAVRAGYAEVWATFPDAHWGNARHFVHGDRGVSEWTFTGTRADGTRVEVHGCDLFTLRGGKIAVKNSYRKNRPPMAR